MVSTRSKHKNIYVLVVAFADVFNSLLACSLACLYVCLNLLLLWLLLSLCLLGASAVLIKPIDLAIFNATMAQINAAE